MQSESIQEQQCRFQMHAQSGCTERHYIRCNDLCAQENSRPLLKRIEELQDANLQLESLVLSISHDLRNPLTSILMGSSYLLRRCNDRLESFEQITLERLSASAQLMAGMIDALLGMCSLSGKKLENTRVDLSAVATSIAEEFQQREPLRKVTFEIKKNMYGWGDPHMFQLVLINLFGNSWKYSSLAEHATIEFGVEAGDDRPVFFVRDNGIGFDACQAESLFVPFKRLNEDFVGTGIGLATVRSVINRMGGRVWAEKNPDKGATFSFTLPSQA